MKNIFEQLVDLLKKDERLKSQDDTLLKNKAQELARKNDPELIRVLLSDKEIKQHFFFKVDEALIFDKEKFVRFVSNKQFLPDSYTAFKNKIGLTVGDEYLSENKEVVLVWPYKDCVLEGGMTKEDQKRDEIFYNETLAPDDINRLLDAKVFTNCKRIDKNGEHKLDGFKRDEKGAIKDNLIIKGNNLLALASLKKEFAGKVKLIYIDPPYNTGNDGFKYNDSFNHSSWLVFMKNRLEIAKQLLSKEGSIWINIDDNESHYLKVLCDDIFGRENFVANIIWHKKNVVQNDAKYFNQNHDHILVFAKNKEVWRPNLLERTEEMDARYDNPDNDPRGLWTSVALQAKSGSEKNLYEIEFSNGIKWKPVDGTFPRLSKESLILAYNEGRLWFGKHGNNVPRLKKYLNEVKQGLVPNTIFSNEDSGSTQAAKEELKKLLGKNIFDTPKPEKLLQRILQIGSKENDLVLDFFAGSGTTLAVAHKTGRQYIGIEQMDYIHDLPEARLKKVIAGEQGGISETVGWKGGGDFVYMELAKWNEEWMEKIRDAKTGKELAKIWNELKENTFLSWKIDLKIFDENAKDFADLTIADQKKFLIECLDKNQLYVNLSEIEDKEYGVSKEDQKLNKEFYEIFK
ncbi:MAG: site-specific DNA-methyltransferase [Patescibacteria group bacterium]